MNPFLDDPSSPNESSTASTSSTAVRPRPKPIIPPTHGTDSNSRPSGRDCFELMPVGGVSLNPYQPTVVPIVSTSRTTVRPGSATNQNQTQQQARDEWAFCEVQFRNIAGFTIKYSGSIYSPDFKVRPHGRSNALPVPLGSVIFANSMKKTLSFCFDFNGMKWQTIKFHRSGNELFHFAYRPSFFGGRYSPSMNIYSPEHHDRIGYVKIYDKLGKKADIVDCINNLKFSTRPHFNELCTCIEIVDERGNVAAVMNGSWGKLIGSETCYQINFSGDITHQSGYTKAVFLTSLALLAIDSREKLFFNDVLVLGLGLVMFVLIIILLLEFGISRID